jgi:hypothetical protein
LVLHQIQDWSDNYLMIDVDGMLVD